MDMRYENTGHSYISHWVLGIKATGTIIWHICLELDWDFPLDKTKSGKFEVLRIQLCVFSSSSSSSSFSSSFNYNVYIVSYIKPKTNCWINEQSILIIKWGSKGPIYLWGSRTVKKQQKRSCFSDFNLMPQVP